MNATPARILVVDDDPYGIKYAVLSLKRAGYDVTTVNSADRAMEAVQREHFDLAIVDVLMPPGTVAGMAAVDDHNGGLYVAAAIRKHDPACKILGFTNSSDERVFEWFQQDPNSQIASKLDTLPSRLVELVAALLHGTKPKPRIFIVHGHDRVALLDLKNFLQNGLHFPEPVILGEMKSGGRTVIEKLEHHASQIDIAFVLLTPDDTGGVSDPTSSMRPRARQNVVFELGYFFGKLGRRSGRVIVLHKGPLEIASDIAGLMYIDIQNGVGAAAEEIRRELAEWL